MSTFRLMLKTRKPLVSSTCEFEECAGLFTIPQAPKEEQIEEASFVFGDVEMEGLEPGTSAKNRQIKGTKVRINDIDLNAKSLIGHPGILVQ